MNWINWLTTILSSENRLALWKHSKKRRDFSIMYSVICTGMSNQQNVWPITWSKWPITALPEVQPQSLPNTEQRWVCPGWPPSLVGQPVRPLHVAFACVQMYIFYVSYVKERCFLTFFCRISPGDLPLKFFNCFFFGELIYILRFRFTPLDISLNQGSTLSVDRFNSTVSLLGSQSVVLSLQACLSNRDTIKSPQNYNMLTSLKFWLAIVN